MKLSSKQNLLQKKPYKMNQHRLLFILDKNVDAQKVSKSIEAMTCLESTPRGGTIEVIDDLDMMLNSIDNKCDSIKSLGVNLIQFEVMCFDKHKNILEKRQIDTLCKNDISICIRTFKN